MSVRPNYRAFRNYGAQEQTGNRIGLLAVILIMLAAVTSAFLIIDPKRNEAWIVYLVILTLGATFTLPFADWKHFSFDAVKDGKDLLYGGLTFIIVFAINAPIMLITRTIGLQSAMIDNVGLAGLAPASEELFFRGFLFGIFDKFWKTPQVGQAETHMVFFLKALPQAGAFAIFHLWAWHLTWSSVIYLMSVAIVYAYAYWRTHSIAVPMFAHGLNNWLNLFVMYG